MLEMKGLIIVLLLCDYISRGHTETFEDLLKKHDIEESSIMVLKLHGLTSTKVLQALERDHMKELNINLGQRAVLLNLVKDLQSSEKESRSQGSCKDKQYDDQGQGKYVGENESAEQENKRFDQRHRKKGGGDERNKQENKQFEHRHRKKGGGDERNEQVNKQFDQMHRKKGGGDERNEQGDNQNNRKYKDSMNEETFWCLFKCFGGIGAAGLQSSEKESRSQGSCKDKQYDDQGQGKYVGENESAEQENKRFDQRHRKKGGGDERNKQENKQFEHRHRKKGGGDERNEQVNRQFDQMHRKKGGGGERNEQGDNQNNRKYKDSMNEETLWCLFKCLGGIGAAGLGGVLGLVAAVYALAAAGFAVPGIVAGSLAAKIMSLYGGSVAAGSWFALFQSLGAAGLSWNSILTVLFGSAKVMTAYSGGCSYCFNEN